MSGSGSPALYRTRRLTHGHGSDAGWIFQLRGSNTRAATDTTGTLQSAAGRPVYRVGVSDGNGICRPIPGRVRRSMLSLCRMLSIRSSRTCFSRARQQQETSALSQERSSGPRPPGAGACWPSLRPHRTVHLHPPSSVDWHLREETRFGVGRYRSPQGLRVKTGSYAHLDIYRRHGIYLVGPAEVTVAYLCV